MALGGMAVAGALALSPVAQAEEPFILSDTQMDAVAGGNHTNFVYTEFKTRAYTESNQRIRRFTVVTIAETRLSEPEN